MIKGVILYGLVILSLYFSIRTKAKQKGYINLVRDLDPGSSNTILYLRAFSLDEDGDDADFFTIFKLANSERDLTNELVALGRLITVGKKGEYIPDAGFERSYFPDERWQDEVLKLIESSTLIILRASTNEWVLWEFEQIIKSEARKKMILWTNMGYENLGVSTKTRYNAFRRIVKERYGEELPEYNFHQAATSENKNNWETASLIRHTQLFQKVAGSL